MKRRVLSLMIALSLFLNLCPLRVSAADLTGELPDGSGQVQQDGTDAAEDIPDGSASGDSSGGSPSGQPGDAGPDGALCPHHTAHTDACGYVPGSPGAPCTYDCPICPVEDLIGKLPGSVTADNSGQVQELIGEIYALYEGLSADEQRQVDLSPCVSLLDQLDGMGSAALADVTGDTGDTDTTRRVMRLESNYTDASSLTVSTRMTIDANGFTITITGDGLNAINVEKDVGHLTLKGHVVAQKGTGVKVFSGGSLTVTDASTLVSGRVYGLEIASGASAYLSAGTYTGGTAAISIEDGDFSDLLAPGYAFFDNNGQLILPDNMATVKVVTVDLCTDHSKTYTHASGATEHTWTCEYCGATGTEMCTFDFDDDGNGTSDCGNTLTIAVDETTLPELVYDGTDKEASVGITVTVTSPDGTTGTLVKDTDYKVEHVSRTDVGEITVTVTGIKFNGTFTKTYHVEQDEPGISWDSTTCAVDYDSSGRPVDSTKLPPITITLNTSNNEDLHPLLQYSYRERGGTEFTDGLPTNAGTYEVKAYIPESQNYKAAETDPLLTLTINPIPALVTAPEPTLPTYDKTSHALVTAGVVENGAVIEYAEKETGPYSTNIPTGINAGDYTVWYRIADTNNYIGTPAAEVSGVEILRKRITPVVTLSDYTCQYDGSWQEPDVTVKDRDDGTVLLDTEYKVTYSDNRDVGTASVVVSDKPDGNYEIDPVTETFEITSRTQDSLSIINKPNTVTYGDKFTLDTFGGSGNGDVTWEITDGRDVATVDEDSGQITVIGDGTATVQATKSGQDPGDSITDYENATAKWTFTADKKPVTATVTADDKVYDGNTSADVHAVVEQGVLPGDEITIIGLTGAFSDENAGANKTVTVNFANTISGNNSEHYEVSFSTAPVRATISKAVVRIATAPTPATLTYSGTAQLLLTAGAVVNLADVVDSASVDVEYALSEDGPYSTTLPEATNAGDYTVWYRVQETGNYIGEAPASVSVSIGKKAVNNLKIELFDENGNTPVSYTYDGTAKKPAVTLEEADGSPIPADEYTVTYSNNIDAGTATVTVTAKQDGNYSFTDVSEDFTIQEEKAKVVTAPEAAGDPLTFSNRAQKLVTEGAGSGGTMVYTLDDPDDTSKPAVYSENIPTATNAGDYTVYYKVKGDGNHSDSDVGSVTVTIAPKTVKDPTIELFDADGNALVSYTYDGTAQKPTVVVKDGSTVIGETDSTTGENDEYNVVYTDNTDAGKATVSITDKLGGNYTVTGSATFEIVKADIVFNPAPSAANITYDGKAHELLVPGTTNGGTVQYALDNPNASYTDAIPTATEAGNYTVYYKVIGDKNHNDHAVTSVPVTISKAAASITTDPAARTPLTYDGQPQALVTAGKTNVGFIVYSLDGTSFSPEIPTGTNAGTYDVYYKVDATGNYTGVDVNTAPVTVTIAPKSITAPTVKLSSSSYLYDGTKHEPEITVMDGETVIGKDQYTVSWDNDLTSIGTHEAAINSVSNGNYTFTTTASVEIVAATQDALSITGKPSHVYYGDTVTSLGTIGGSGNGTVTWSVTPDGGGFTIDPATGVLTIKDIGTVTVKAERVVPNYGTVSDTWTFTVEPKPVVAEVTISAKDYDGTTDVAAGDITASVKVSDLVNSETITISDLTGTYDNANAGTGKTVTLDASQASASDTDKYTVSYPATVKADINPKAVTVEVTLSDHDLKPDDTDGSYYYEYDGTEKTPAVTVKGTDDDGNDAVLAASDYTVRYADNKNVGTATVTVTNAEGGNYTFDEEQVTFAIKEAEARLTSSPQANDLTYTGQAQELVTVGTASGGHIEYSKDGSTYSTAIPTETKAGIYIVYYKVVGDGNHTASAGSGQVSVTIKPKEITPAITLDQDTFTYDGNEHKPAVTVKDGSTGIASDGTEYTVTYRDNINAGTATVIVSDVNGGNYIVNGTKDFTIEKANPTVTAPAGKSNLQYNGELQELVTAGVSNDGTVVYSVDGGNYSAAIPTASAVATYSIQWKLLGDANHKDTAPETLSPNVEIAKNTVTSPTISLSADTFKYSGSQQKPVVIVYDGSGRVIPEYEYTVTITGGNMVDVGTYTVTITPAANSNYDITTDGVANIRTFEIVAADQETISITNTPAQVHYGDVIQLGTTGGTGSGSISWTVTGTSTISPTGLLTVKDVGGPITVTATRSTNGGNYSDVSATWEFSAAKKQVTAVVTVADKTYDGSKTVASADITAAVNASDLVSDDSITITGLTGEFDSTSAGTNKTVTLDTSGAQASGKNADKYDIIYPATATASILAVAATVDAPPDAVTDLTYDASQAQALIQAGSGSVTGGTMVYSLDNTNFTPVIPKAKDAMEYTVYFKAQGDGNHTDSAVDSVKVVIDRQTVTTPLIELTPPAAQYDGNVKRPGVTVRDSGNNEIPTSEYKVTYVSDNNENWTDPGDYTVKIENISGGNYVVSGTETFTISKTAQNTLEIVGKPGLVYYGDTFTLSAVGGSGSGVVTWESSDDDIASVDPSGFVTIKGVGPVTITAKKPGGTSYDDVQATYSFNAWKKPITAVVTADDRNYIAGDDTATIHITWNDGDLVGSDCISILSMSGTFDDEYVGTNKTVTVNVTVVDDSTAKKYDITIPGTATASILKADMAAPSVTGASSLEYTGSPQDLVSGGDVNTRYSDSRDGVYSETVPTGTNAGTYTVWYKAVGDSNHNDSEPKAVTVGISRKTLTNADVTITLTGSDMQEDNNGGYYCEYDGTDKTPSVIITCGAATVPASEYTVSYSGNKKAGTATVTITNAEGGNYIVSGSASFEIIAGTAHLTSSPQANDLTYTGQAQELVTVGTASGGHVEYSEDGSTYSTVIPTQTKAGTYIVYYKVVGDGNHTSSGESGQVSVTIKPKEIVSPKITVSGSYTYDGGAQEPNIKVEDGSTLIPDTEYTITYRDNIDAGTATVIITNANGGNYIVNGTAAFTIEKADLADGDITAPAGLENLPYNGTAQALVTAGSTSGGTMVYSLSETGEYSPSIPTETAVGTYEIWYRVQGDGNHKNSEPDSVDASIIKNTVSKATVQVMPESVTYDGQKQKPTVTVYDDDNLVIDSSEYTVMYTDADGSSVTDLTSAGVYTVTVTSTPSSNYVINDNSATFTILPADQPLLTITGTREHVYYGDKILLNTTGGSGTISWSVDAGSPAIAAITNGLLEITGVGPVTVTATSTAAGYTAQKATWSFYAEKKPVTAVVTAAARTYSAGDTSVAVTAALQSGDLVNGDDFTITLSGRFEDPDAGTGKKVTVDSRSPAFTVTAGDPANYNITYPATTTASILKADIDESQVTAPTAVGGLVYTGNLLYLVSAGSSPEGTMEYSLDDITYSASLPTGTDAGDYGIWYRVKGGSNYNDTAGKKLDDQVTIAKQKVDAPTIDFTPSSVSYDGAVHKPSVTVKDNNGREIPDSEYTVTYDPGTDWTTAGSSHKVTITGRTDGNYDIKTADQYFTILAKGQVPLSIVNPPDRVQYGDSFTLNMSGGSGTGAVTWSSSDQTVATIDHTTGAVKVLKPGPFTISVKKASDDNYSEQTASWTFSAEKKPVTVVVTAKDRVYDSSNTSADLVILWPAGGLLNGDSITLNLTGQFNDPNAGENKLVTITGAPPASAYYEISWNMTTTASITPATAAATGVTAKEDLVYDRSAQALVNEGEAAGGTLVYSLDGRSYTPKVPTGTAADSYTVWYKAEADSSGNYRDSALAWVDVTIERKTVDAPKIELYPDTFVYDGSPKEPEVVVLDGSTEIPASEYTVRYSGNTAAGTATVTVTSTGGGNYDFGQKTANFTIEAGKTVLTKQPEANNLTYNSFAQPLVTAGTAENGSVVYSTEEDGNYTTTIPKETNAGTYQVWYKVVDSSGTSKTEPALVTVTIQQVTVTPTIVLESDSMVYTGGPLEPEVLLVFTEDTVFDKDTYRVTYANNTKVGTSAMAIVQSVSGNYKFTGYKMFEIIKGQAAFSTVPEAAQNLVYNGTAQKLVVEGESSEGIVVYSLNNVTYSAFVPTGVDAGGYVVFAKVQGGSAYEDSDIKQIRVNIAVNAPKNPRVELSGSKFSYTGEQITPSVTVYDDSNNVIPADEYTVRYEDNVNVSTDSSQAKVTVTSKGTNYSFTASATFTIVGADQPLLAITGKPDTVYYGDTLNLKAEGGSGTDAVTWKVVSGPADSLGSGKFEITGSGLVTIQAVKPASAGYEAATAELAFYAQPKQVEATVIAADKVYNGKTDVQFTVIVSGLVSESDISSGDITATGSFKDGNVGENKTVMITGLSIPDAISEKYAISYLTTTTASITPKTAAVTDGDEPQAATSLTYNGSEQALLTSGGSAEGGNIMYSLDGSSYSYSIPTAKNAGTYTVWYKAAANDSNYKDSTPVRMDPVTIDADTRTPSVQCTPSAIQYDGTAKTPAVEVRDYDGRLIPASEYKVTMPANPDPIKADTYTVTVTDFPGGNYEFGTATGTFQIVEASQPPVTITGKPGTVYYGDTFGLSATGGSGSGAIQWSITNGEDVADIDGSGFVTVKGVGSFTIEAYRAASDGYSVSNTDRVTFYAYPKPITPVVTADDRSYNGTKDATLVAYSNDLEGNDDVTFTVQGEFATADVGTGKQVNITITSAGGVDVGKYAITWPKTTTASISMVDVRPKDKPAAVMNLTYDGNAHALVTPGTTVDNIGVMEYSLDPDGVYSEDIPTGTNAGEYTVWYRVADSVNYKGLTAASIKVVIAKAKPKISTPPTASALTYGQSLSESVLTNGEADVAGTFVWENDSFKPEAGTSQQNVIFRPADAVNYETVPLSVPVTVNAPDSGDTSDTDTTPDTPTDTTPDTPADTTPDTPPTSSTTPSPTPSNSNPNNTSTNNPTADGSAVRTAVQNGTASTVVSEAAGSELVRAAAASQSERIVIEPEITGEVTRTEVSIPASTVSRISSETDAALVISSPIAGVAISNAALGTLSLAGGDVSVTAEQVEQAVVLTLTAGGKTVESVPGGVTLTVPVEDAAPGTVAVLVHEDGTRETLRKSVVEDGQLSIPLDGSATVEIVDNSKEFADVPDTSWAAEAVAFASAHELFNGTSETTFSPDEPMSRAMLATVLYNLEGSPEQDVTSAFSDVASGDWYAEGVAWAAENGIVSGYGDGQFGPDDSITREQFTVMLWRYAGSPAASSQTLDFTDAEQVSDYALEALCWAVENGIMNGYGDGLLAPEETATRAEAAQMLKNFMENT